MSSYRQAILAARYQGSKPKVAAPPKVEPSPPPTATFQSKTEKLNAILQEVAIKHDIPIDQILSKSKMGFIVKAKRELQYLVRLRHKWSLPTIAAITGTHYTAVRNSIMQHCHYNNLALPEGVGSRKRRNN